MSEQLHVNQHGRTGQGCSSTQHKGASPLATGRVGLTAFPSESHVQYFSANGTHLQNNLPAGSVPLLHSSSSGSVGRREAAGSRWQQRPGPPSRREEGRLLLETIFRNSFG